MLNRFFNKLFEEIVFLVSLGLTLITFILTPPSISTFTAIDFRVIASLFCLMLVSVGLESERFLDMMALNAARRFHTERRLALGMGMSTALLAMLITNDVALITMVPVTLIVAKRGGFDPFRIIVVETICANIGSSLLPFGNPQNLYIYNFYNASTSEFIGTVLPFTAVGIGLAALLSSTLSSRKISFDIENVQIGNMKNLIVYLSLFILTLMSITRIIDIRITTILVAAVFMLTNRGLILKIDYFLLMTFVLFFIFVHNMTASPWIKEIVSSHLSSPIAVLIASALSSQAISNVPAAILLSPFVDDFRPLLIGVSIGGLGTMIASLANLISYKYYVKEHSDSKYSIYFLKTNLLIFALLLIFGIIRFSLLANAA